MNREVILAIIAALGAGGLGAAFFDYLKKRRTAGPESQSIIVDAAQGAVIVQQGVIQSLQDQFDRARLELEAIHATFADVDRRLRECEEARDGFEREIRRIEQDTEMDRLAREGKIDRRETPDP